MPTVSHLRPWKHYPNKLNHNEDVFTDEGQDIINNVKKTNESEDSFDKELFLNNDENGFENDVEEINYDISEKIDADYDKVNNRSGFEKVTGTTKQLERHLINKENYNYEYKDKEINSSKKKSAIVEITKKEVEKSKSDCNNVRRRRREEKKTPKWKLNSGMLVTLVILNVTGQGVAVEVISTSTLASLLGYPTTCTLGAEVHPCTLSLTCWLRGGTRARGCGGWLFACCQPPENWSSGDNSIQSSDWQYKVSPPRIRQVPQRNVMPNNVFRRRVDEDVTQVDCGVASNRILQKRIIGGREARFAEFPWQAHVRISEFQCGGVLVSQWFVATAAHCVSRAHIRDIVVWLGALDTSAGSHTARKVGVNQKILHPLFQFRMTQPDRYDIALLKLSRPIAFTRHIRAICLPESAMPLRGRSAVIAGWGKTDATDTHTGTNMLRSATVPILSKEQCITWHQSKQISVEIHSEMICAGHSDGHQDACLGDSGGPLIVPESGRYYLVGITSAGFGCGVDHQPGIYHNVQVTASWIRRVLALQDQPHETHGHKYQDSSRNSLM